MLASVAETLPLYICEHAHFAPFILFFLLVLTGFNVPISEDLIILAGGAIASTCIQDHSLILYLAVFSGSGAAAWIAYGIGRVFGEKLFQMRYFQTIATPYRMHRLSHYFEKFGIFTFIVGRFCPGGVRNAIFLSSGLIKMPFYCFALRDVVGCLISTLTLFYLGYISGQHFDTILSFFHQYSEWALALGALLAAASVLFIRMRSYF